LPVDADVDIGADFTRGQAWYDLILAVDPNQPQTVFAGGIDLFRSTDGGTTWVQISKWSDNNQLAQLAVSTVHADQHAFTFYPGSSDKALVGNDGGVYFSSAMSPQPPVFSERNNGYNVTQFYSVALHPGSNVQQFLGGTQDNGTPRFTQHHLNATTDVVGGDGAYCFIDETDGQLQVASYVYNTYLQSVDQGITFNWNDALIQDYTTGDFINPAAYDGKGNRLFSSRTTSTIYRIAAVGSANRTVSSVTVTGMSAMASHLSVSPFSPPGTTTLYIGTKNGALLRVPNAQTGTSLAATNLGASGLPTNGSISCIAFGASENDLVVTYFNYGLTSVWRTTNGGTSWTAIEGNLPDMPARWALRHPDDPSQVILATELGIWTTLNAAASPVVWTPSINGLENVRVDMLQMRASDRLVAAATFGRGIFTSSVFAEKSTWVGAVSTLASNPLNWQPEAVPSPQTDVVVPANALRSLEIDTRMEGGVWHVEAGARIEVLPGAALDLTSLTNEGSFLLHANALGYGQLRTPTYTGQGSFETQKYWATSGYHPVAFPNAQPVGSLGNVGSDAGPGIQNVFTWNAAQSLWTAVPDGTAESVPGTGYIAYTGASGVQTTTPFTVSLAGVPTGSVPLALAYHDGLQTNATSFSGQGAGARSGWNFLGNSLPCDLDFLAFTRSNVAQAFYVFDPTLGGGIGGYRAHSPGGVGASASSLVPPMTGFWVQTTAPGASLGNGNALSASAHGRTTARTFSNKGQTDRVVLRVAALNDPQRFDDVVFTLEPTATWEFDPEWDAREWLHGTHLPNLAYRHQGQYSTHKAIPFGPQALSPVVVPAFFQGSSAPASSSQSSASPSLFVLSLDPTWTTSGYGVYLQDHALNTVHPLHSSSYIFADTGDSLRFSWIFAPPGTVLSDAGSPASAPIPHFSWKDDQGLFWVETASPVLQAPELFDLTGRSLGFLTPEETSETSETPETPHRWSTKGIPLQPGLYLIRLRTAAGEWTLRCL
jgi:hypothetical protein